MEKTKWNVDPAHTAIGFKAKYLMLTNVRGNFTNYEVQVETDSDNFNTGTFAFKAETDSISTGNAQRDGHLKSKDFFDVSNFPLVEFKGNGLKKTQVNNVYELTGELTIHGITKVVNLVVEHDGVAKDPYGNIMAGFNIQGSISRKEFGLTWNAATETGGVLVGDEVKINCDIQLKKVV